MRILLFGLAFIISMSSYACTCESAEDSVVYAFSEWQQINPDEVVVSNLKETVNPVFALPTIIRSYNSCDAGCSMRGIKVTANIQYQKEGKNCTAKLVKPARFEMRLSLKDIECK